jgi:23S rRNA (cytosine1962-C5)-methyltransferase
MPRLWLEKGREAGIKGGYLWVHPPDVQRVSESAADGGIVDLLDSKGRFLGRAVFNRRSPIVARVFSRRREDWDEALVLRRLLLAMERRRRWGMDLHVCRLVFGESDGLPGLVIDRYGPVAVFQIHHPAMERLRGPLVRWLAAELQPQAVFERSDPKVRAQEGLPPSSGLVWGDLPRGIWIAEQGVQLKVDVAQGQKTGHYLDQKMNRARLRSKGQGRRVLDLFCYTGGFGLQALAGGAASVMFVDSSGPALRIAKENVGEGGWMRRASFVQANAFDLLRSLAKRGRRFDLIFIDPPAFAPSTQAVAKASRGYKELNLRALKLLARGGILASSSCSSHMPVGLHLQLIAEAAADAEREVILLHQWTQDLDHPIVPAHPPSRYLKCHVLEVVDEG